MRIFTGRAASAIAVVGIALTWATVASARIYYDPNSTAIRDLETWQLVVVALLAVVVTGLLIAGIVKFINRFFSKK